MNQYLFTTLNVASAVVFVIFKSVKSLSHPRNEIFIAPLFALALSSLGPPWEFFSPLYPEVV